MSDDIAKALYGLRLAFARNGVPCPDVLEYSDSRKGYEAARALRRSVGPVDWSMDRMSTPYSERCLGGFTLRFEGREIERPGVVELDDGISGRIFLEDLERRSDKS